MIRFPRPLPGLIVQNVRYSTQANNFMRLESKTPSSIGETSTLHAPISTRTLSRRQPYPVQGPLREFFEPEGQNQAPLQGSVSQRPESI